jgi:hypothetical protein
MKDDSPRTRHALRLVFGLAWLVQATGAAAASVGTNTQLGSDAVLPPTQRAQTEPHIVRSPRDNNFLVAIFQEGTYAGSPRAAEPLMTATQCRAMGALLGHGL